MREKVVLISVRIHDGTYTAIWEFLACHGMEVIEVSAQEHDKQIAHSLLAVEKKLRNQTLGK